MISAPAGPDPAWVVRRILRWYDQHARVLPWREPGASPWAVLVSEVMLQQTPVERVRGPWAAWLQRWPTPAALAAEPAGEAVRAWGRLGYPRRALRLHQAATAITERFGGEVPADRESLLSLPGIGGYTAAAVASFAYGRRELVLDTNVRRVLTRIAVGRPHPPTTSPTRTELALADAYAPRRPDRAARWAVASMELGALVCRAAAPRCAECPVRARCAWRAAGYPAAERRGRTQAYDGSDRQARGALLAVLRAAAEPVEADALASAWPAPEQRNRALTSLIADGLVVMAGDRYALPG